MKAKGTAVKSTVGYVKKYFPNQQAEWLNALPERSKLILTSSISVSQWYDVYYGVVLPTQTLAKLFFDSDVQAASWQIGRFTSQQALTGLLRFILKIPTPSFVIGKASHLLSSYYDEAKVIVDERSANHIRAVYINFEGEQRLVYYRIAGWLENTLQSINLNDLKINLEVGEYEGKESGILTLDWSN